MRKIIIITIGILAYLIQVHAATPATSTIMTGDQACRQKSGTTWYLNSVRYITWPKIQKAVSGEVSINTDTTLWKTHFYKYGTSIYYLQITATGGQYTDMSSENISTSSFGKHISGVSLYRYDCTKKTNTEISKENLHKVQGIQYIRIEWIKGWVVSLSYGVWANTPVKYVFSLAAGKIYNFASYKNYTISIQWARNIQYSYLSPWKLLMKWSYTVGSNTVEHQYIISLVTKTVTKK